MDYRPQNADGSLGPPVNAGWDVKNNKPLSGHRRRGPESRVQQPPHHGNRSGREASRASLVFDARGLLLGGEGVDQSAALAEVSEQHRGRAVEAPRKARPSVSTSVWFGT